MDLRAKLDEIKSEFKSKADKESLAQMERGTKELEQSGILQQVLRSGDRIPEFTLTAARGGEVKSQELLSQGPLVLTFYRGVW